MFEDLAFNEEIGPVADRQGFIYIMVRDQDADVLVFEAGHHRLDILHGNRIHTRKRFIQQDEAGINGQGPRNLSTPAFATTQGVPVVLADMRKAELVQQLFHLVFPFFTGEIGHLQYRHDIVFHRQLTEYRRLLREVANAHLRPFVHG